MMLVRGGNGVTIGLLHLGRRRARRSSKDDRLLCAQPTPLGDRIGTYDGMRYCGPLPLETLLSQHCWQIAEARRDSTQDGDVVCEMMQGYAERVLGISSP